MNRNSKITIIGIGLMGGSISMALKSAGYDQLYGVDTSLETLSVAKSSGIFANLSATLNYLHWNSDLVIYCTYNNHILESLESDALKFDSDTVITDICGVKTQIIKAVNASRLKSGYISIHPMAGSEKSGFENADKRLIDGSSILVVRTNKSNEKADLVISCLTEALNVKRITECSADEHDYSIAYTSHLTHIVASALCYILPDGLAPTFTGGGFRDTTRIGNMNVEMWSSLLEDNKKYVLEYLDSYIGTLNEIRNGIAKENALLQRMLSVASERKVCFEKRKLL